MLDLMPNTSFQRTLTRGGFGPLNSDRSRRFAPRTKRELMNALTPALRASEQVVRADHRCLASHASVLRLTSSAAQLPFR
jgi:hypothetical protein